jgi:hypothetical protein
MQSAEVEDAYRRAAEIGAAIGDGATTFKAKWGLWLNANIRRKTALARDRASELVTLAHASGDGDLLLEAYHCRWSTAFSAAMSLRRWPIAGSASNPMT